MKKKWKYLELIMFGIILGVLIFTKKETRKEENNKEITEKEKVKIKKAKAGKDTLKNERKEVDPEKKILLEENSFTSNKIDKKIRERILGKSYQENTAISLNQLRYIKVLYCDFNGEIKEGELIVHESIAEDVIEIFRELYKKKYPIEKMVLIDEYDGDDNASMADNNTSCFNYRKISNSQNLSKHSLGLAIDINPLYNPCVKKGEVQPEEGKLYENRSLNCKYYIDEEDLCCKLFKKYGFTWGGDWNSLKDYQHFEKK
ncbi:MAG: M15 family metallopeptidase [Acetivibrio sp.]